jgi:hypothetical protein
MGWAGAKQKGGAPTRHQTLFTRHSQVKFGGLIINYNSMSKQDLPPIISLENRKRAALQEAIQETLPDLAKADKEVARQFAIKTLEDIRQGNNPDLEPEFRKEIQELGISLK